MSQFEVLNSPEMLSRMDRVVIHLRREGFSAWGDCQIERSFMGIETKRFFIHTNADRSLVLMIAGHGLFLK